MADPTDREITRACAEMMKLPPWFSSTGWPTLHESPGHPYTPLDDDAQNAQLDDVLLGRGSYRMLPNLFHFRSISGKLIEFDYKADMTPGHSENRRRARCLCVWKIAQEERK